LSHRPGSSRRKNKALSPDPCAQIDLDTLIKWVKGVKPRTQDDIGPLLDLTRDVLARVLESRLSLQASGEVGLRKENQEVCFDWFRV
jgi:hypothetical protein